MSDVLTFTFFISPWVQTGYDSSFSNPDLSAVTCSDLQALCPSASICDSEGWWDAVRHVQSLCQLYLGAERCVASWDMKWRGGGRGRTGRSVCERKKQTKSDLEGEFRQIRQKQQTKQTIMRYSWERQQYPQPLGRVSQKGWWNTSIWISAKLPENQTDVKVCEERRTGRGPCKVPSQSLQSRLNTC